VPFIMWHNNAAKEDNKNTTNKKELYTQEGNITLICKSMKHWPKQNGQSTILAKYTFAKIYEMYAIIVIIAISWSVECLHYIMTKTLPFINYSQILDLVKEARSQPLQNTMVTITSDKCHKSWAKNPQTQANCPKYNVLIMYAFHKSYKSKFTIIPMTVLEKNR